MTLHPRKQRELRLKKLLEKQLDPSDLDQVGGGKRDEGRRGTCSLASSRYCTY